MRPELCDWAKVHGSIRYAEMGNFCISLMDRNQSSCPLDVRSIDRYGVYGNLVENDGSVPKICAAQHRVTRKQFYYGNDLVEAEAAWVIAEEELLTQEAVL